MYFLPLASLGLLVLSGVLLDAHRRAWFAAQQKASLGERERRCARAVYLRRMQAGISIGMIGVLLMLRPLIPQQPFWFLLYLLAMVLLCVWLLLLAMVDVLAASLNRRQSRREIRVTREDLEAEIRAAQENSD